jgi:hypothetical protein
MFVDYPDSAAVVTAEPSASGHRRFGGAGTAKLAGVDIRLSRKDIGGQIIPSWFA